MHAAFLLVLCAVIYFPWLGTAGFASSEGHRVVPGWTMVDSGDWTRVEMFERTYIRKPPGMPWAIGAFALAFGQNEWSARAVSAVSATLCAFVCWLFARSWFGPRPAVYAGAAQALLPLLWLPGGPGRTAEIEMLLLLGTQLAALSTLHVFFATHFRTPSQKEGQGGGFSLLPLLSWSLCIALTVLGVVIAALAKGVAAAPVLIGVMAASGVVMGIRAVLGGGLLALVHRAALLAGVGVGAGLVLWIFRVNDHPDAVRETGTFLWTDPVATLTSAPIAFISAAPVSFAMLWVFGPDARRECGALKPEHPFARGYAIARTLTLAWLITAVVYTLVGVSNPRYLLPASVLFAPIVGYVVMGMSRRVRARMSESEAPSQREGLGGGRNDTPGFSERIEQFDRTVAFFTPARRRLARVLLLDVSAPRLLGAGRAWVVLLVIGALVSAYLFAYRAEAQKSRQIGREIHGLCEALNAEAVIADGVIEARPDVLLYARIASTKSEQGSEVERESTSPNVPWWPRLVWEKPGLGSGIHSPLNLEPSGGVRLRLDRADVGEHAPYALDEFRREWTLGRYRLVLHGGADSYGLPRDESDFFP